MYGRGHGTGGGHTKKSSIEAQIRRTAQSILKREYDGVKWEVTDYPHVETDAMWVKVYAKMLELQGV